MKETFTEYCTSKCPIDTSKDEEHPCDICSKVYFSQQEKISELEKQVEEAERVIAFYGDENNWGWGIGQKDLIVIRDDSSETIKDHYIGGKRAREYLTKD